jgi:hypothetical protein
MQNAVTVDAFEFGFSGSYNIPVGKSSIGIAPGGGFEFLISPRTGGCALYGFGSGSVNVGGGQSKSGGGGASFGVVFNTPKSQNYTQLFLRESIPYTSFPPALKTKIDGFIANGVGLTLGSADPDIVAEAKSIGMVVGGVIDRSTVNVFWDPTGGGSWGMSFSYACGPPGTSAGVPSFSGSYYWQILPGDDKDVKFE